jgi:hypothetical protein
MDDNDTGGNLTPRQAYGHRRDLPLASVVRRLRLLPNGRQRCGQTPTAPGSTLTNRRPQHRTARRIAPASGIPTGPSTRTTPRHRAERQLRVLPDRRRACGRQVHCDAAPARQAAWDLVARDSPRRRSAYSADALSSATSCSTRAAASSVAGRPAPAEHVERLRRSPPPQWLAADDDDGNLNNGTPHRPRCGVQPAQHGVRDCPEGRVP